MAVSKTHTAKYWAVAPCQKCEIKKFLGYVQHIKGVLAVPCVAEQHRCAFRASRHAANDMEQMRAICARSSVAPTACLHDRFLVKKQSVGVAIPNVSL